MRQAIGRAAASGAGRRIGSAQGRGVMQGRVKAPRRVAPGETAWHEPPADQEKP